MSLPAPAEAAERSSGEEKERLGVILISVEEIEEFDKSCMRRIRRFEVVQYLATLGGDGAVSGKLPTAEKFQVTNAMWCEEVRSTKKPRAFKRLLKKVNVLRKMKNLAKRVLRKN